MIRQYLISKFVGFWKWIDPLSFLFTAFLAMLRPLCLAIITDFAIRVLWKVSQVVRRRWLIQVGFLDFLRLHRFYGFRRWWYLLLPLRFRRQLLWGTLARRFRRHIAGGILGARAIAAGYW